MIEENLFAIHLFILGSFLLSLFGCVFMFVRYWKALSCVDNVNKYIALPYAIRALLGLSNNKKKVYYLLRRIRVLQVLILFAVLALLIIEVISNV